MARRTWRWAKAIRAMLGTATIGNPPGRDQPLGVAALVADGHPGQGARLRPDGHAGDRGRGVHGEDEQRRPFERCWRKTYCGTSTWDRAVPRTTLMAPVLI